MSAHDPGFEAHVTNPPPGKRPTSINVDETGISMSWRTAVAIIGFVIFLMLTWNTFAQSLLKAADLAEHDALPTAHAKHPALLDPIKKAEVIAMVEPIRTQGEQTARVVAKVQDGIYEQRADDLAYRAIEQLPKGAGRRRISTHFEKVKKRALVNQKAGRNIRDGIDVPVM
ncbi:MAG: hypothetical protein O7G84_01220 [Gammaproteobacteria bacterium]|nr:hypothetical protein [Gammaproteobacteria bacterium]